MNDFIINVLQAQGPTIWGWPINSPLVGSFLGVIAGFGLKYASQSYKDYREKLKIKNMLRSEIEACVGILSLDGVQLLPTDRWNSAVNSGALKFFEVEIELKLLSNDYYRIQEYNIRARRWINYSWKNIYETADHFNIENLQELRSSREWLQIELKETVEVDWLKAKS